jgi:hypothetical protein
VYQLPQLGSGLVSLCRLQQRKMALGSLQKQQQAAGKQCRSSVPTPRLPAAARRLRAARVQATAAPEAPAPAAKQPAGGWQRPDAAGRYGQFGGKYVPETLIPALAELEVAYQQAMADPAFKVCAQASVLGSLPIASWGCDLIVTGSPRPLVLLASERPRHCCCSPAPAAVVRNPCHAPRLSWISL